ncbi:MAG: flagellar basal body P-ring formation protein FlgA [Epsilonproteobacteria bacterium]|nr:flagellar basal body P-ring formation protein FlgA [Campylobacterota bacterium]
MVLKLLFLILITINLFSQTILQKNYYINGTTIKLSDIINSPKKDKILFNINDSRHIKRVKTKELIELLGSYGYKTSSKHPYTQFTQRSPADFSTLQEKIGQYYQHHYINIEIQNIFVQPRSFMQHLPKYTAIKFQKRSYLNNRGIFSIKSGYKEIYFNYRIDANLLAYFTKNEMARNAELSQINTYEKKISLQKFRAPPLQKLHSTTLQTKHKMKKDTLLTQRDVEALYLVKRGSIVHATLENGSIDITFFAKARQNGRLSDIIKIQNNDGKILKAKVIAKGKVEIE